MERDKLICCLVGKFTALEPNISSADLKLKIDNSLIDSKLTPLGTESGDADLLQDLLDETIISVLGQGINRKLRRSVNTS